MSRYIDAYKIPYHDLSDGKGLCQVAFLEDIVKVPTADVRENVRGEWIEKHYTINCSVCKNCLWSGPYIDLVRKFNFCPNCGAYMRGDKS